MQLGVLVVAGGVLCGLAFRVEQALTAPAATPGSRAVTLDVVVSDAETGVAIPGAEVAFDRETGQFAPPGPAWLGATDLGGLIRLLREFNANTVSGTDGKVRGRVVFHLADAPLSFSDLLLVRAPGYRAATLSLDAQFPQGFDYEDLSPQTIRVRLSPTPVPDHP